MRTPLFINALLIKSRECHLMHCQSLISNLIWQGSEFKFPEKSFKYIYT